MAAESRTNIPIAGGAVAVAVGTYLSWFQSNPNLSPDIEVPTLYATGMNAGFEGFDFALLGAVGLVLLLRGVSFRTPILVVVGTGTAVYPVYYLSSSTLFGFSATFVPTLGWYLTDVGGVLFIVASGFQHPAAIQRLKATADPRE